MNFIETYKLAEKNQINPIMLFVVNEAVNIVVNNVNDGLYDEKELDAFVEHLSNVMYDMYCKSDIHIDAIINAVYDLLNKEKILISDIDESSIDRYLQ